MAPKAQPSSKEMSIETWSINQVSDWIEELGFDPAAFKREKIDGECLISASHEMLKELQVESFQDRIAILNQIYKQKQAFDIEIEEGDYEPLSANPSSPVMYENQCLQQIVLKKKQEEREYIVNILTRQLQEINLELSIQKTSKRRPSVEESFSPRSKQSIAQQMKSPQKSPISANTATFSPNDKNSAPTPLSAKQEQILKSAMELYGNKPKNSSKGWNFL